MKRIFSVALLLAVVAFATPFALAQKPGDKDKGNDDQSFPGGGRHPQGGGKTSTPRPQPQPQPQPQPDPRRLGPTGGGNNNPGKSGSGLSGSGNQGGSPFGGGDKSGRSNDPKSGDPRFGQPGQGGSQLGKNSNPGGNNGFPNSGNGSPNNGNGFPNNGNGLPKTGNGQPDNGNGFPSNRNGFPKTGNGQPDSGNGFPNSGNGFPKTSNGQPNRGNGQPNSGNGQPNNGNGVQTNGNGLKPSGRDFVPKGGGQSDPTNDPSSPRGLKKTDITPPNRGAFGSAGNNNPIPNAGNSGNPNAGNPGNSKGGNPVNLGGDQNKTRRVGDPVGNSGKPFPGTGGGQPNGTGNGQPNGAGNGQPGVERAVVNHPQHKALGKPSGRGFDPPANGGSQQTDLAKTTTFGAGNAKKISGPVASSPDVASVGTPARMRKSNNFQQESGGGGSKYEKPEGLATMRAPHAPKAVQPTRPVVVDRPQGGRTYTSSNYHHEYDHQRHSSFAFGLAVSDGNTALAFGYANGGHRSAFAFSAGYGCGYGYGYDPFYHPYWHCPVWYEPVVYAPCYAVAYPVYYSPVYATTVVDPWAYNNSSFAFGFSSFGGCALSSFSFAYSSSNWGVGFGWAPTPCYTVYTPAYDPYVRSAWVDGYYELVDERVWVPGRYEEQVNTPVTENIVDPLGNTYDAVTEAGSVDYAWHEGYWTTENRRIWHPGHFEYVSTL